MSHEKDAHPVTGREPPAAGHGPDEEGPSAVETGRVALVRLLELQEMDTAIGRLKHRRSVLPERAELSACEAKLARLAGQASDLEVRRGELAAQQSSLEAQIEGMRERRSQIEKKLYGGHVTASRELQAMDSEAKQLAQHVSDLEDQEILVMEQIEPIDADLASLGSSASVLGGEAASLRSAVEEAEGLIEAELGAVGEERAKIAASIPGELLARYERVGEKLGGTGAAPLVGDLCGGCHLRLPATEVDRIKHAPPDELILCDQCGRILVR